MFLLVFVLTLLSVCEGMEKISWKIKKYFDCEIDDFKFEF